MFSDDTIVAISSAVGPAARMIVRMSGPAAQRIAAGFSQEISGFPAGSATRANLRIGGLEFSATVYSFRAPRSATGEDVVEIHLPGNPFLARMVLDCAIAAGARAAEAGEFTARAFFNGRIELSAAEGVSAVISAQNERELTAARRLLAGELSHRLAPIMALLAQTLALVEAGIDFAGEEITVLDRGQTRERIGRIDVELTGLLTESSRFEALSHEPRIVLVGRPNAGKSTLLNTLAGFDRAIISPIAGTTRDVLSAGVMLGRGRVTLIDAAGLDEGLARDEVSRQMARASLSAVETADVVVLVREVVDGRPDIALPRQPHLRINSKADLSRAPVEGLCVSAQMGDGIQQLRSQLDRLAFGPASAVPTLALNARHLHSIAQAQSALRRADAQVDAELIALELREALDSLGSILGTVTPDDILGRIFSSFCIGK
jgi:tRNA modification GTPase